MGIEAGGTFELGGERTVHRMGYGAMRLCGPGVWGFPGDRDNPRRVLARALELGVDFFDTADAYGPEVNEYQIAECLAPYDGLVIATGASAVAAHLVALGASPNEGGGVAALGRWTPAAGDPCVAVAAALAVLGDLGGVDALEAREIEALSDASFVPVAGGASTEAPRRLWLRAPAQLAPLAFELPSSLTEHAGFLRKLGLRDELTPADADAALRVAAKKAKGRALGPNELRAAVAALRHAAGQVDGGGFEISSSSSSVAAQKGVAAPRRREGTTPVPDSFGVLAPSTSLFHAWGAPSSLLQRLDRRKLRLAHDLVPANACACLLYTSPSPRDGLLSRMPSSA